MLLNGWVIPDQQLRNEYSIKLVSAMKGFAERAVSPGDAVWLASLPPADYQLKAALSPESAGPPPRTHVCVATAETACDRLAQGTHRLATAAEIQQFHTEDKGRAELCAAMTMASRNAQSQVLSAAFVSASQELGPTLSRKKDK
jgi:hypothetical protein